MAPSRSWCAGTSDSGEICRPGDRVVRGQLALLDRAVGNAWATASGESSAAMQGGSPALDATGVGHVERGALAAGPPPASRQCCLLARTSGASPGRCRASLGLPPSFRGVRLLTRGTSPGDQGISGNPSTGQLGAHGAVVAGEVLAALGLHSAELTQCAVLQQLVDDVDASCPGGPQITGEVAAGHGGLVRGQACRRRSSAG